MKKIFCKDCKVKIENKGLAGIFGGEQTNPNNKGVEYADGWRCGTCDHRYRKEGKFTQKQEGIIDQYQQRRGMH